MFNGLLTNSEREHSRGRKLKPVQIIGQTEKGCIEEFVVDVFDRKGTTSVLIETDFTSLDLAPLRALTNLDVLAIRNNKN